MEHYGVIYKLTSPSNKLYIGQTIKTPKERWLHYKRLLCKGQLKLFNALKKYGPENFKYEVIDDKARNQVDLDFLECFYIDWWNTIKYGYNNTEGGKGGRHSAEVLKRISIALTGRHPSDKTKEKIRQTLLGMKHSPEVNAKKGVGNGRKHTEENKQKIKEASDTIRFVKLFEFFFYSVLGKKYEQ